LDGVTASFDWATLVLGVPAGDYNDDGLIDLADYRLWQDNLPEP
jgi:hypothetical protein